MVSRTLNLFVSSIEIFYLIATGLLLILGNAGCGVKGSSQGGSSSESLSLSLSGTFLNSSNDVVSPSSVVVLNSGDSCVTDSDGNCEISTENRSGNLEVEVSGAWGSNRFVLSNIPARAESVTYEVQVNPSSQVAILRWQNVKEQQALPSVATLPPERCGLCHELHQFTRCALPSWVELHRGLYNCDTEGEVSPGLFFDPVDSVDPSLVDPGSSDLPVGSATPKPTPKVDSNSKYKTGLCVSCHSYRGTPQCGSSFWAGIHGSFYSCGNKTPDKKKPDNKKPDDKKKKKRRLWQLVIQNLSLSYKDYNDHKKSSSGYLTFHDLTHFCLCKLQLCKCR